MCRKHALLFLAVLFLQGQAAAVPLHLDDFENIQGWSAHPADGVDLELVADRGERGGCLRLDFDFHGGGGYAVAHKALAFDLPDNYAFSFRLRGEAPPNHLEFKLLDDSGENVWWCVRRDMQFSEQWQTVTIKKRHITFAWGPAGGGELRHVAAIEFAITAGSGGRGHVWIDDLELRPLASPDEHPPPPTARASTAEPGGEARNAVDGDSTTAWQPWRRDGEPWIRLDLGEPREFSGLVLDWCRGRQAQDYVIEISDDGESWRTLRTVQGGNGGRDYLYLPESETRFLRLRVPRNPEGDLGLCEMTLQPVDWAPTRTEFFEAIAREAPRGTFPRGMSGEQTYWTVVGVNGGQHKALLSEDGALETGRGAFSLEPFLFRQGRCITWSDVKAVQSLDGGSLPIPSVRWRLDGLELTLTAFGLGDPESSRIVARYRLENRGSHREAGTLFVALRPFQVNPPSQFLNLPGGAAPLRSLVFEGRRVRVNAERDVVALTRPSGFGAVPFDGGDIVRHYLRDGRLPEQQSVDDDFEAASGAFAFSFDLAPGETREAALLSSLEAQAMETPPSDDAAARAWVEARLQECRSRWSRELRRVTIQVPDSVAMRSLQAQLGWILVNRTGAAIRPGSRAYARSWIRDGALTSSALCRLGHADAALAFLEWYAPYQFVNGKIPCVVDERGADPTPEHDSTGEFLFLVAETYRYAEKREEAEEQWPRLQAAVGYLDSLRQLCRGEEFRHGANRKFFGLLPPSISHEGYSAKPMHSYWDDFWAVRGLRDAVFLAAELGHPDEEARWSAMLDEFRRDVAGSIAASMQEHGIDYVPGCADLGDFDATSTTILLSPVQAADLVSPEALRRTFEKYDQFFQARREGAPWEAFTPYEIRNIGAFLRLGWRARAMDLLPYFLAAQRPPEWRQWPEVVWHDPRAPHFLGDLPHGWVASDFIRSFLDLLAYERDADASVVIAAGVPPEWLEGSGVQVQGLVTPYGSLSYHLGMDGEDVVLRVETGVKVPPGGLRLRPPAPWPIGSAHLDGQVVPVNADGEVELRHVPATLVLKR
jgi:hypothetical protein